MHDNYDVKGRVLRIDRRLQSVESLKNLQHLHDHDSFDIFDIEFLPSGQVVQQTSYTFGAKVHGSKRFIYAERGELLRTLEFGGAGSSLRSTDFRCDSEGRCVGWTGFDPSGALTRRCVRQYAGKLLVSSATSDAKGAAIRQEDFEYAASNLVKSGCRYYGPDGTLCEMWTSHHDTQGRLIETFGLTAEGASLGDGRHTYEYDADGRKIKTWSFNDLSDDKVPNAVTVFEYKSDEIGNWVERHAFHRFRSASRWTERITNRKLTYFPSP
jgi:hypothetical protein